MGELRRLHSVRPEPVEGLVPLSIRDGGFDKLGPNGWVKLRRLHPIRPEPVEGFVPLSIRDEASTSSARTDG